MSFEELHLAMKSKLMTRGLPCKVHQLQDKSFVVIVSITGAALSIDIPYTIREVDGLISVSSDDSVYEVTKPTSVVSVIAKDIRGERAQMLKFTKR